MGCRWLAIDALTEARTPDRLDNGSVAVSGRRVRLSSCAPLSDPTRPDPSRSDDPSVTFPIRQQSAVSAEAGGRCATTLPALPRLAPCASALVPFAPVPALVCACALCAPTPGPCTPGP